MRVLLPTVSFFPVLALAPAVPAQTGTPGEPAAQEAPEVVRVGENTFSLRWHGTFGRSYFVQASSDLVLWHHMPVIKLG